MAYGRYTVVVSNETIACKQLGGDLILSKYAQAPVFYSYMASGMPLLIVDSVHPSLFGLPTDVGGFCQIN